MTCRTESRKRWTTITAAAKKRDEKGDYNQIFSQFIPYDLVKTIHNIYTFREEFRKMSEDK